MSVKLRQLGSVQPPKPVPLSTNTRSAFAADIIASIVAATSAPLSCLMESPLLMPGGIQPPDLRATGWLDFPKIFAKKFPAPCDHIKKLTSYPIPYRRINNLQQHFPADAW